MNCSFASTTGKKFGLLQDICLAGKKNKKTLCIFFILVTSEQKGFNRTNAESTSPFDR